MDRRKQFTQLRYVSRDVLYLLSLYCELEYKVASYTGYIHVDKCISKYCIVYSFLTLTHPVMRVLSSVASLRPPFSQVHFWFWWRSNIFGQRQTWLKLLQNSDTCGFGTGVLLSYSDLRFFWAVPMEQLSICASSWNLWDETCAGQTIDQVS